MSAGLLGAACQGDRQPPITAAPPLFLTEDADRTTLVLDERTVPQVAACNTDEVVQRTPTGWACTPLSADSLELRDELDRLKRRIEVLERGPAYFVAARACAVEDPDDNLRWRADCAFHRGGTAAQVVLRCPVAAITTRDRPETDGLPRWTQLYVYGEDREAPPEASTATFELFAFGANGLTDGLTAVAGTRHVIDGGAMPAVRQFGGAGLTRLMEARVVLVTRVGAGVAEARFCGFGLGPT